MLSQAVFSSGRAAVPLRKRNADMTRRILTATVGAASAALAAGVMWTAPSASAGTPYCDGLPPAQAHDCNCGADFEPGTPEFHDRVYGAGAATSSPKHPS